MKIKRIERDLSWLSFNERVLQEANDPTVSLYDRLKFLGIYSNNMDEFFRVRVATLLRMTSIKKISNMYLETNPQFILEEIQKRVLKNQRKFNTVYNAISRQLKQIGIEIVNEKKLKASEKKYILRYFIEEVRPTINPLMIESLKQAPQLKDNSIYLACILASKKYLVESRYALIEVPTNKIGRFIILPKQGKQQRVILLEDVIRFCLPNLFEQFGYDRFKSYIIKLTRDAELDLDEEMNSNYINAIEKGLKKRKRGKALRFVYDKTIDNKLLSFLISLLHLGKRDHLIPGGRVHNHKDFIGFPKSVFPTLPKERKQFTHPLLRQPKRILKVLDEQDVLLHVPYHSFDSITDLIREAAIDPDVRHIKISCYRLANDSEIINGLINAIQNGKEVTVVLELRARFNEEDNLQWKQILEEAGASVFVGEPHRKIHAKMCVITKEDRKSTKYYSFISTGNLNEDSAEIYSDHYLITSHKGIGKELDYLFKFIANKKKYPLRKDFKHIICSPLQTRDFFIQKIEKEMKAGSEGGISIKLNSCTDNALIEALEKAAQKGVSVSMNIRGVSRILPDQKKLSGNLESFGIVDAYLEHSRIMYFKSTDEVYISSSDWMRRNLDHRIEVTAPIYDKKLKTELKKVLTIQQKDNVKSRVLDNKQQNKYRKNELQTSYRSQLKIQSYLFAQKY